MWHIIIDSYVYRKLVVFTGNDGSVLKNDNFTTEIAEWRNGFLEIRKEIVTGKNQIGICTFKYILRILLLFKDFAQIIHYFKEITSDAEKSFQHHDFHYNGGKL